MAVTRLESNFVIDKRLLAINFDELALIESVLFTPKPVNIIAIKKRFSIPLPKQQLIQDMLNPNSLFFKWIKSILMSEIARCLLILDESFRRTLISLQHDRKHRAEIELLEAENYELISGSKLLQREKLLILSKLVTDLNQPLTLKQLSALGDYLLEAGRANALKYYLSYVNSEKEARVIYQLVEQRYQIAKQNFAKLKSLQDRTDLTPEQREYVDEVFERYARRFEPENIEIMHRVHSEINLDDPVVREQYLRQQVMNEELLLNDVEEALPSLNPKNTEEPYQRKNLKPVEKKILSKDETRFRWKLKVLQDKLNNELSIITEQNEDVIIQETEKILTMQNSIQSAINDPTHDNFKNIYTDASNLKDSLDDNQNCFSLEKSLNEWCQQNASNVITEISEIEKNPDEFKQYKELLISIECILKEENFSNEILFQFKELYQLCKDQLKKKNGNEVVEKFNQILTTAPTLPCLDEIRNKLETFNFINKKQLLDIKVNSGPSMDF